MHHPVIKMLAVVAAGASLAACNTTSDVGSIFDGKAGGAEAHATLPPSAASTETTGSIAHRAKSETRPETKSDAIASEASVPSAAAATAAAAPAPSSNEDDLNAGRAHFRAGRFAEAEAKFHNAAKMNPHDAEAWLGLAACYDRMRRFELADRAYVQAAAIKGPTTEILNNQGYSYLLRGDMKRARNTLTAAKNKDPDNIYVQNNLQLLEQAERKSKSAAN
jgi:Flp pilus assembly protein TadD